MKCKFSFNGKKVEIKLKEMKGINKFLGLMFYRNKALFFSLNNQAIHSLFCPRFLAIWLDKDNKVVEHKMILPWKSYIKPEKDFSKLIEIPINDEYKSILSLLNYTNY